MTSLANIFTTQTALPKIMFGRNIFIGGPIFSFFVALFKTFGMQKDDVRRVVKDLPDQSIHIRTLGHWTRYHLR